MDELARQKKLMHLRARLARTKTAQGKINLMNKIERLERGPRQIHTDRDSVP